MLKTILRQTLHYRRSTLLTPLFAGGEVVFEALIPFTIASLIDLGISAGDMQQVYRYGSLMLLEAFLSLACGVLAGIFAAHATAGFGCNLRSAMYRNIQTFSFADIDKFSTSGLVTRMTTDVTNLQNAFQMLLRIAVRAPLMLVISITMCLLIDRRLSIVFIVAMVVLSAVLALILWRVSNIFPQVFRQYDALNTITQENITGIRVVKSFVREEHETDKFDRAAGTLYSLFLKAETMMVSVRPVMNIVIYSCIITLSWLGAQYIVGGTLTTGQLTSMFTYVMSILMSLMMISMIIVMVVMSVASARRIAEVIDEKTSIRNPDNARLQVADGSVDFCHVDFAYRSGTGENVLGDIDLHIRAGEKIGIIGATGSGKSTLVSLISRLYDTSRGSVLVGGLDVREYDIEALRRQVSVVLQNNVLFSGSVMDNLRWGNMDATSEQCRQACRIAQADGFVSRMPDGYTTRIEQGGANVSGGQRQRLCIARALLKQPKILILDDSTSACDTGTEAAVHKALFHELTDMTVFVIAQRISSVRNCDRILVLDKGRISGFDTHDRLLQYNRIYSEINAIQSNEGGDFDMQEGGAEL